MTWTVVQADTRRLPIADSSVDLIVSSPPYWGLRSYRDDGEHYDGQVGAESTPAEYVNQLVGIIDSEWRRVLKPSGSVWLNLGDKYAGSGGHNNSSLAPPRTGDFATRAHNAEAPRATRRNAPDRYSQESDGVRAKSQLNLPHRVAIAITDRGWIQRATVIWSKPNGIPESVTDRVRVSHEYWFHFTLEGRYFSAVDEIREPHQPSTFDRAKYPADKAFKARNGDGTIDGGEVPWAGPSPLGRTPGSVRVVPTQPLIIPDTVKDSLGLVDHFAAFPMEWPRWIIEGWSPKGGTILDPFGGTGTTAGVAHTLGRIGISVDLSMDYSRLAQWRIGESGDFASAEQKSWKQRQLTL